MREALKEAKRAYAIGEVPVGAVLVSDGRILARGHNQVELLQDATAHAEMLALGAGAAAIGNWRLLETTLYCTLEPCAMCAGALLLSRVKRVVWGAPDLRHGANGSWIDLFAHKHPMHAIEIVSGVLAAECAALMKEFFHARRDSTDFIPDTALSESSCACIIANDSRSRQPVYDCASSELWLSRHPEGSSGWGMDELIVQQAEKVLRCGQQWIPQLTAEDVLQPFDYPQLENNAPFRYEEGILEGMQTMKAALLATLKNKGV